MEMSLFQAVRLFSAVESAIFAALLVVALGHVDERATFVLGLTHGIGFLGLCALIYYACLRRALPWPVLASAVLLTPWGSSIHIELLRRRPAAR
jgi:phosphoglycerol transferase MdoB-like AlkP superfamily enzyme